MQTRRERWKRRILRYRKAVHGYVLYIMMLALFLWLLPIVVFSFWGFEAHVVLIVISMVIFTLMALVYLVFTKKEIIDKFGWLMLIVVVPFFGAFLFWFVGISQMQPKIYQTKMRKDAKVLQKTQQQYLTELPQELDKIKTIAPMSIFTTNNQHEFLTGQAVYDRMLQDILDAKQHIHLEMYIVRYDATTEPLFQAIIQKAKAGVEVRFLVDVFGTLFFKDRTFEFLIDAGVEISFFNQQTREYLDHSHVNHRKNLVIDGKVGYTGGFNLGAEYVHGYPKKNLLWYDLMVRIEGNLVHSIQEMFLLDWLFSTEEGKTVYWQNESFFPQKKYTHPVEQKITQFISDGPDRQGTAVKDTLRHLIISAKERIYITTPYLIPSDDIINDLKFAALSGIDVRIIIPAVPDKKIVYYSTQGNIEGLLASGVKIYKMNNHFIHSKLFIFDNETTMYGTVNLDMRSFYLNLEENVVQYGDHDFNTQAAIIFANILEQSSEIEYKVWKKRKLTQRFLERVVRILNPLF